MVPLVFYKGRPYAFPGHFHHPFWRRGWLQDPRWNIQSNSRSPAQLLNISRLWLHSVHRLTKCWECKGNGFVFPCNRWLWMAVLFTSLISNAWNAREVGRFSCKRWLWDSSKGVFEMEQKRKAVRPVTAGGEVQRQISTEVGHEWFF